MKKLPLLLLLLFPIISVGQNVSYSFNISYQQSFIAEVSESIPVQTPLPATTGYTYITNTYGVIEQYSSRSGGSISGNIKYSINSKIFIQSGLKLNLIRYNQQSEAAILRSDLSLGDINFGDFYIGDLDIEGNPIFPTTPIVDLETENQEKLGNTSILYTEIPIYLGYSFLKNKLTCKLGIITSLLTYAQQYTNSNNDLYYTFSVVKDNSADGFKNLMFSGNIELEYLVYKNVGINISYSRSLNSIYDENVSVGSPKYNIIALGLSYSLLK